MKIEDIADFILESRIVDRDKLIEQLSLHLNIFKKDYASKGNFEVSERGALVVKKNELDQQIRNIKIRISKNFPPKSDIEREYVITLRSKMSSLIKELESVILKLSIIKTNKKKEIVKNQNTKERFLLDRLKIVIDEEFGQDEAKRIFKKASEEELCQ